MGIFIYNVGNIIDYSRMPPKLFMVWLFEQEAVTKDIALEISIFKSIF
jgi:hypothetical protein